MFLFTVMSITRCIQLLKPFARIRKKHIIITLSFYLSLLSVMFLYPMIFCKSDIKYHFIPASRIGRIELSVDPKTAKAVGIATAVIYDVATTLVPIFLIAFSCCLVAFELVLKRKQSLTDINMSYQEKQMVREKRSGAMTVLLLSTTTLLCFLPINMFLLNFYVKNKLEEYTWMDKLMDTENPNPYKIRISYLLTTGISLVNSSINPLIFMIRCYSIRDFYRRVLTRSSVTNHSAGAISTTIGGEKIYMSTLSTRQTSTYKNLF